MHLRLAPITSIKNPKLLLSVLELFAFARGEAVFSDLDIDFDTVLKDAQDDPSLYELEDEADLFSEEPQAAVQLLEEFAIDGLFELVDDRQTRMGRNYAFERVPGTSNSLRLKQPSEVNAAAYATAWLSFFDLIDDETALNMPSKEKRALRILYARVFELVALLAATMIFPSVGWWTGRNWTTDEKFNNFNRLCELVKYGKVKSPNDWETGQVQSKDGGADAFLVTTIDGELSGASLCIALGATVQRRQRQKKKLGKDERDRLLAFYLHRPTIALIGAAADPYPAEPSLAQDYARADCLYLNGDVLWKLLSLYQPNTNVGKIASMSVEIEDALKTEMRSVLDGVKVFIAGQAVDLKSSYDEAA